MEEDAKKRKAIPIFSGVLKYFPDALAGVAVLSRIGNEQHNPGEPLHWDRNKSTDQLDALTRHLIDYANGERVDPDGALIIDKIAWRALAQSQKDKENAESTARDRKEETAEKLVSLADKIVPPWSPYSNNYCYKCNIPRFNGRCPSCNDHYGLGHPTCGPDVPGEKDNDSGC